MRPHLPCQCLGKAMRPTDVRKQSFISSVLSKLPFGFPQAIFISTVIPLWSCCISGSPAELCRISESGSSYLNPYKCRVLKQHSWIFQPTFLSLHPKSHWFVLLWRSSDFCNNPPLVNSIKPWFQPWTSICFKKKKAAPLPPPLCSQAFCYWVIFLLIRGSESNTQRISIWGNRTTSLCSNKMVDFFSLT